MKGALVSLCFIVSFVVVAVNAYGEDITTAGVPGSIPTWQERSFATLLNLMRVDPPHFRDAFMLDYNPFMNLTLTTYAPQTALRLDYGLLQSAAYHAYDIASTANCTVSSASCNGTTSGNRSNYYYPCGSSYEATAAIFISDPRQTLASLICQQQSSGGPCIADASGQTRSVFLFPDYLSTGIGYYSNTNKTYSYYWVVDIGTVLCNPVDNPIIMGSHFFNNTDSNTVFAAVWSTNAAPQFAEVVIDGVPYNLTLTLGNQTHSGYTLVTPKNTTCRQYYFGFMDSQGNLKRFPDTGNLITYGEGSCTDSFVAGPGFPTTTTTTSANAATTTTTGSDNGSAGSSTTGASASSSTTHSAVITTGIASAASSLTVGAILSLFVVLFTSLIFM